MPVATPKVKPVPIAPATSELPGFKAESQTAVEKFSGVFANTPYEDFMDPKSTTGLSPQQLSMMMRGLQSKYTMLTYQQGKDVFPEFMAHLGRPAWRTVNTVIDWMMRPQMAAFGMWKAHLEGKEPKAEIEAVVNGLRGRERTRFREVLDSMEPMAKMRWAVASDVIGRPFLAAAEIMREGGGTDADQAVAMQMDDYLRKFDRKNYEAGVGTGVNPGWPLTKRIKARLKKPSGDTQMLLNRMGVMGDLVIDPLLLGPAAGKAVGLGAKGLEAASAASKIGRAAEVGAKVMRVGEVAVDPNRVFSMSVKGAGKLASKGFKAVDTNRKVEMFLRGSILRGTGITDLDPVLMDRINAVDFYKFGLDMDLERWSKAHRITVNSRKDAGSLIYRLAEENKLDDVLDTVRRMRTNMTAAELADPVMTGRYLNFETVRNPDAVKSLLSMSEPEIAAFHGAVRDLRPIANKVREVLELRGVVVPQLGGSLRRNATRMYRAMDRRLQQIVEETTAEVQAKAKTAKAVMDERRRTLKLVMPKDKVDEILQGLADRFSTELPISKKDPATSLRLARRAGVRFLNKYDPRIWPAAERLSKSRNLYEHLNATLGNTIASRIANDKKLARLAADFDEYADAIDRTPLWVTHMATPEGAKAILQSSPKLRRAMTDPRTASFVERQFTEEVLESGRPLSVEEVNARVRALEYGEISGNRLPRTRAEAEAAEVSILYKDEGVGKKSYRWFRGKVGKPIAREIADFLETDPVMVFGVMNQRSARAMSMADYYNDIRRMFTYDQAYVDALPAKKRIVMEPFEKINASLVETMPALRGRWVNRKVGQAIVRAGASFTDMDPMLKFMDAGKRFWMTYSLPIWPAFHTRNRVGNLFNMRSGGWMTKNIPRDTDTYFKSQMAQWYIMRREWDKLRDVKFNVPALGGDVDGYTLLQYGLRQGAFDSGIVGSEIADLFEQSHKHANWWEKNVGKNATDWFATRAGRAAGRYVENGDRYAFFIHNLQEGLGFRKAAERTRHFLGDYRGMVMTPFERNVMSRAFWFYRWSRFNIPLQAEQLVFNPRMRNEMIAMRKAHEAFVEKGANGDFAELPYHLPKYIAQAAGVPLKWDKKKGTQAYFVPGGWLPLYDLDALLTKQSAADFLVNAFMPPASRISESLTGMSTFTGEPVGEKDAIFGGKIIPTKYANWMRGFRPFVEWHNLDLPGMLNPEWSTTMGTGDKPAIERLMRYLTGVNVQRVNTAKSRLYYWQDQEETIQQKLSVPKRVAEAKRANKKKEK
jgi:hypothetical protein